MKDLFDPATQEDFYLEENLFDFHNEILPVSKVNYLASDLFEQALAYLRIQQLSYSECIGFKIPLFLNGREELSNYNVTDMEVYWEIEYQLYQQASKLPPGTRISGVDFNPF